MPLFVRKLRFFRRTFTILQLESLIKSENFDTCANTTETMFDNRQTSAINIERLMQMLINNENSEI